MRTAPNFKIQMIEGRRLLMGHAQDRQIGHAGQSGMVKHRARHGWIMIARQQHHRAPIGGQRACGLDDQGIGQAVAFKRIANQQNHVGMPLTGDVQH